MSDLVYRPADRDSKTLDTTRKSERDTKKYLGIYILTRRCSSHTA
jgi:hypothetical protein